MRTLRAMSSDDMPAKQELRQRIALSNRPRLNIGMAQLDTVALALASSKSNRRQFIDDPTSYLQEQDLPVSSCSLVRGGVTNAHQTSEVVSVVMDACANATCQLTQIFSVVLDFCFAAACRLESRSVIYVIGIEPEDQLSDNVDLERGSPVL